MLPAGRLCLHTPRADCNGLSIVRMKLKCTFASTRSVQIATCIQLPFCRRAGLCLHTLRADCNVVAEKPRWINVLCLHTLRADCNNGNRENLFRTRPLPPHAPCRLQPNGTWIKLGGGTFASTRSVQIATRCTTSTRQTSTLPPHAPCRLQRQKCTELQYALFRTCVESVDSFSVLNKSMLR